MIKRVLLAVLALAMVAGAYWWIAERPATAPGTPAAAPPPPEVGVVTVRSADVPFPVEFAGRVIGIRDVEVRALVGGTLLERGFEEGALVTQGQLLFRIDPAPYHVALQRAEAQLHQAEATLKQAEENFERIEQLFQRGVSTQAQRDEATAGRDQARASVELARAEIASARLNLGYTTLNAPVGGVTALQSPPVGTLILAQQTLLTTITPLDPAYVGFSFTDEENQAFRALNARRERPITASDLEIELHLGIDTVYPHKGRIDTAAQRVDPQTGTIQARAVFPNPGGDLLPGQFVRLRITGVTLPDAIVVPKQAISQGPTGPSVFALGANNVAEVRPVRLGEELPNGWVVREGLRDGERIVAEGIIRVRPGAPVTPAAVAAQAPAGAGP